jgi:hypothetical protein
VGHTVSSEMNALQTILQRQKALLVGKETGEMLGDRA